MDKKNLPQEKYNLIKLRDDQLFEQVVSQLEKDIHLSAMDASFLDKKGPLELLESLKLFFAGQLRRDPEKLRALLYRVDVREDEISRLVIESIGTSETISDLATSVIMRELQKVLTRQEYRSP